jgi:hypothetical protein
MAHQWTQKYLTNSMVQVLPLEIVDYSSGEEILYSYGIYNSLQFSQKNDGSHITVVCYVLNPWLEKLL